MSAPSPILRGTLDQSSPIAVLHELEGKRVTGELRFSGDGVGGTIRLFGGEIAVEQTADAEGRDPVDLFLGLTGGQWSIQPTLPPLPVSTGSDHERRGSLAVHVPVDLMSYCEQAGLTGVLELTHEGRRAEAIYEVGELLAIELDGRDATDLREVFAWERGRFRVTIDPEAPARHRADQERLVEVDALVEEPAQEAWAPAPPSKREDTRQFLRVVEMALADVIDESEKARSPTRTSPPLPPPPKKRPRPESVPAAPRRRRDPTVRLIYLTGDPNPGRVDDGSTRHVHAGTGALKEKVLTEAKPDRRAEAERSSMSEKRKQRGSEADGTRPARPKAADGPKTSANPRAQPPRPRLADEDGGERASEAEPSPWVGFAEGTAWAIAVLLLGLTILTMLAQLPRSQ